MTEVLPRWGLSPATVISQLREREWDHREHLRGRLNGSRGFPIDVSLQPPTGPQAASNLAHFQRFVSEWRVFRPHGCVVWESVQMRQFGEQSLPTRLVITDLVTLAEVLDVKPALRQWNDRLDRLSVINPSVRNAAIRVLGDLAELPSETFDDVCFVLPQLRRGMGQGGYLRSLPLLRVGTKFVESNQTLLARLLDGIYSEQGPTQVGGLEVWLDVRRNPAPSLLVRPLCASTRALLHGAPVLWVSSDDISGMDLSVERVIVVENVASALALPNKPGAIAIAGGGGDVQWLSADWICSKPVAYWGDLDTWGLYFLDRARGIAPHLISLMMDIQTLERHSCKAREPKPCDLAFGERLTRDESEALAALRAAPPLSNRLEQEMLSGAWIREAIASL